MEVEIGDSKVDELAKGLLTQDLSLLLPLLPMEVLGWGITKKAALGARISDRLELYRKRDRKDGTVRINIKGHASPSLVSKLLGIGESTVSRASTVAARNPAAFESLMRGESSVNVEYIGVGGAPGKHRPSRAGSPWLGRKAQAHKRRMIDILSKIEGACLLLDNLKVDLVLDGCTPEEALDWLKLSQYLAKSLRNFGKRLSRGKEQ